MRNALAYVLRNHAIHAERAGRAASAAPHSNDPYSSAGYRSLRLPIDTEPITPAQTWLLQRAILTMLAGGKSAAARTAG